MTTEHPRDRAAANNPARENMQDEAARLLALAERCEAATGPSRNLGRSVLLACGLGYVSPLYRWLDPTASLDSAMSLASGKWSLTSQGERAGWEAWAWEPDAAPNWHAAATPALALCAAVLRSRAAQLNLNDGEG